MPRKVQLPAGQSDRPVLVKTARKNEAYRKVCETAVQRLEARGYFQINEVVDAAGMSGVDFYWRALEKMIEEDFGEEILPVTETFFKRRPAGKPPEQWAKECCVNAGRRVKAGYVAYRETSAPVVSHVLNVRRNSAEGSVERVRKDYRHAQERVPTLPITALNRLTVMED